jgi:tRNA uridine 5-carbamoylmethylation protein Kti12
MDDNTPKPKIEYSEFKRILEAQRAGNKTAEAIETSSKKLNDLTEEIHNDDKKVVGEETKENKKLNKNIEELVKITRESAKDIAKAIADKQPKSFGDNIKSKFVLS